MLIDGGHTYAVLQEVLSSMAPVVLPAFTADDVLPDGEYSMTFADLRASILAQPDPNNANWDFAWRARLVDNLEIMVLELWAVGVTKVFVDGSFVENKDHPNDIDGYFECDLHYLATGALERDLNVRNPHKVWTWDHTQRSPGNGKLQLPMWHRYRVELYPHVPGFGCGISDQHGNELEFPAAFRKSRNNHTPKGIIRILPTTGVTP